MTFSKRNAVQWAVVLSVVIGSLFSSTPVAEARRSSRGGNRGNSSRNNSSPKRSQANTAAIDAARRQVSAAQAEVNKANAGMESVASPLRAKFEASPDMTAALTAQHDAQTAHDQADAALDAKLQNDPSYQAATKKKTEAAARVDALRQGGEATQQQIDSAATESMQAGTAVTQIQTAFENADPNVLQTRSALVAAIAKVSDLQRQFQESLTANPQWIAAKKAVDDAGAKLTSAERALSAAEAK